MKWFACNKRHIAFDIFDDGSLVSTVFLGVASPLGTTDATPLLWETAVIGLHRFEIHKHSSHAAALEYHAATLRELTRASTSRGFT